MTTGSADGRTDSWGRRAFTEQVMGLPISLHVRAADPYRGDVTAAARRVMADLREADRVLSTWTEDSDLMRLRSGRLRIGQAHDFVAEVVDLALLAEERTDGLFTAFRRVGSHYRCDPTGLVKGWAVGNVAGWLTGLGELSFCLGAGGDLIAGVGRGVAADDAPVWRIGIEDPADRSQILGVVPLRIGAVATSGTAARGAHLWDRDGHPITGLVSQSVIGPELMWADIWATAACVDPDRVRELLPDRDPAYGLVAV